MDVILMIDSLFAMFSPQLVMGAGALIGASIRAGISIYSNKKELGKKFVFQPERIIDTIWQSTLTGLAFAMGLGSSVGGILEFIFAVLAGAGADSLCNKAKVFNVFGIAKGMLDDYKKKKAVKK